MPTNLYGPNDNFNLDNSHVLPALIRKFHLAKLAERGDWHGIEKDQACYGLIPKDILENLMNIAQSGGHEIPSSFEGHSKHSKPISGITLWGTGNPRREFLFIDDLAEACFFLMNLPDQEYDNLLFARPANQSSVQYPQQDKEKQSLKRTMPLINIGCGEDHSVSELAAIIAEVLDYRGGLIWDDSKPDGTPQKLLDVTKLNRLGLKPKFFLEEGINITYSWYIEQIRS
jgi:GDP-L-fucose synthase